MNVVDKSPRGFDGPFNFFETHNHVDFQPPCKGSVEMWDVEVATGERRLHHSDHNVVVNYSRYVLATLIGASNTDLLVTQCKFGNCGLGNSQFIVQPPTTAYPTVADTDLVETNPLSIVTISGSTYFVPEDVVGPSITGSYSRRFRITMDSEIGNDGIAVPGIDSNTPAFQVYTEMGLFTADGNLYARKVFPSYVKTLGRVLVVLWSIVF